MAEHCYAFENSAIDMEEEGKAVEVVPRQTTEKITDGITESQLLSLKDPDTSKNCSRRHGIRVGIIIGVLSALFFSGNSFFLKILSQRIHPFQSVSMAMPILILGSSLVLIVNRPPRPSGFHQYLWLLFGGVSVSMYMTFITLSLSHLDVADAVTISYTSLIFVGGVSWIILKEPLRVFDFILSIIAFVGVVFIARPSLLFRVNDNTMYESKQLMVGIGLALVAALGIALILTVFRKLSQLGIFKGFTILSGGLCTLIINSISCTAIGKWSLPTVNEWLISTAAGSCYFLAHVCIVIALTLETSTTINVMTTFDIIFSFLWQFLFLSVSPHWTSYVGAVLVTSAALGMALYRRPTLPQTSDQAGHSIEQPMESEEK